MLARLLCALLGHKWVEHANYEYTCRRCGSRIDANF